MNCPRCQIDLKLLELAQLANAQVYMCEKCEGAWYPLDSFDSITDAQISEIEASDLSPALEADTEGIDLEELIACPVCSKQMDRYSYVLQPDVKLDRCEEHGIWLDDGELGCILEQISIQQESIEKARRDLEAAKKDLNLKKIAKGSSALNPVALTLRVLNKVFSKN